jgi:hypothetical protein
VLHLITQARGVLIGPDTYTCTVLLLVEEPYVVAEENLIKYVYRNDRLYVQ